MRTRFAIAAAAAAMPVCVLGADLAPEGTEGTLTLKITAEGGARQKADGSGMYAREWKMKNSAQLSIRMVVVGAMGAPSQDKLVAAQAAAEQAQDDRDEEVIDKWEEKRDACNDEEKCVLRVMGQMSADPAYQRAMNRMQGSVDAMMAAAQAAAAGPNMQIWSTDPRDASPASGTLHYEFWQNVYGGADSAGGGRVDVKCHYKGSFSIGPGSPGGKVSGALRIDAANSRYEIRLPVETFQGRLPEECWNSKTGNEGKSGDTRLVRLIGVLPVHAKKNFDDLLTVRGPVGSPRSPRIGGRQTFTTELLEANLGEPVPVKVTIDWRFFAHAR